MTTPTPDPGSDLSPEELERLRERLAAPAPPEGALDRAREAALATFDEIHPGADSPAATLRDIGSGRRAPRSPAWYQRIPLGAAAAIVAVVALVGVFSQIDTGGDDDTATAASDDSADDGDSGDTFEESGAALDSAGGSGGSARESLGAEADDAGSASGGDGSAEAPTSGQGLAVYDDVDALVDALQTRYGTTDPQAPEPAPSTTSTGAADFGRSECDAFTAARVEPATVLSEEFVILGPANDQAVAIVVVYDSDETGLRVAVVDEASCTVLDDRAL